MNRYSLRIASALTLSAILLAGLASGQDNSKTIGPYIEDQTIAIIRVDTTRIDAPAALTGLSEIIPNRRISTQFAAGAAKVGGPAGILKEAGAQMYAVFNLTDVPRPGPFMIITLNPDADRDKVLKALSPMQPKPRALKDNLIYVGPEAVLERIDAGSPALRPGFAAAFKAAGDAPVQIVIATSADQRRVLAEMLPQLPDELGGGSGRAIATIDWLAVGMELPPTVSLDITIQSQSEEAARSLKSTLTSLLVSLSTMDSVREAIPKIKELTSVVVPKVEGSRLKLRISKDDGNLKPFLAAVSAPVGTAQDRASQVLCTNNMKQLALAMHIYHDRHKRFPPAASESDDGEKLLSWRVHLLPYLEQAALYEKFHLDEPWDSDHNKKLIAEMPKVFACPSLELGEGKTSYLAPTGEHGLLKGTERVRIRDIRDGTSNTIMIVDAAADSAVIWTKPDDLEVDPDDLLAGIAGHHEKAFHTAFCDGSVRRIPIDISPKTLRLLFDPDDGNPIPRF